MCGLAGIVHQYEPQPPDVTVMRQMLALLRHRGPDEAGIYHDARATLGHVRLSIIDLTSGRQPIGNEDGSLWIVFNGEIFNYVELRPLLLARGHRLATTTDTEVLLHLYEEFGPDCLTQINGQFAFAIWDARRRELFLARDRVGIRPLFYTINDNRLLFASEIKALLAVPGVAAKIDPAALDQIFTYWSPISPHTIFRGIRQLPPGHYAVMADGELVIRPYWQLTFPPEAERPQRSAADYLAEFRELLVDAVRVRLRADVPVGAYLSGGLDSSTITALIRNHNGNRLSTFSISFTDPAFDESVHQRQMAQFLGTDHETTMMTHADIGRAFPDVVWHTETPILRTAPAPMYYLAQLVRRHDYKVVLTGEGADEFLAGYNIFKEAMVRRFWARQPDSTIRPLLLHRLYPYIGSLSGRGAPFLHAFFGYRLTDVDAPDYSHALRWHNTSRAKRFFAANVKALLTDQPPAEISYPADFANWHPLHRAQYLEATQFLPHYLLCSQGDRMGMAHAIEGRFPFLDHRVIEFCNRLPPALKLRGLTEKLLLKRLASQWRPAAVWQRPKRPYRAPIQRSFFPPQPLPYVTELLQPSSITAAGLFHPRAVTQLVNRMQGERPLSETDEMALTGILSAQLVHHQFVQDFHLPPPLPFTELEMIMPTEFMEETAHGIR